MTSRLETFDFCVAVDDRTSPPQVCARLATGDVTTTFAEPRSSTTFASFLSNIEANVCGPDDVAYVGHLLWSAVFNGPVLTAFWESYRDFMSRPRDPDVCRFLRLRLNLSPKLRDFPWECFYVNELGGALAGKPGIVVVRDPPSSGFFVRREVTATDLRILVAVPHGSGLNSQQERNNLQRHAGNYAHVEEFLGQVTPDALASKLKDHWDIFHFLGHGMRDSAGHVKVLLNGNGGGEAWIRDETIADLFARDDLRLAILNCCMGDRHRLDRSLSGLGPLLSLKGIPSVIAMRYEIADDDAITFSEALYRELLRGPFPGRIDWAVAAARAALSRNATDDGQRSVITPVLYLAPGYEQLFKIERAAPVRVPTSSSTVASDSSAALPAEVERAIREGCCVPVIGPAALGWTRDHALTPLVFARYLAQDKSCVYPLLQADLDLCERAGEWLNGNFLQWVCQHREAQNETRSELVELVQAHYASAVPPPHVVSFCRWKVPALFYTYFDGFLESEVTHGKAWLNQVIYDIDKPFESTSPTNDGKRFLILLRGSHRRGRSLVLTESDHDALADKIRSVAPQITELTLKEKQLTLFLGVSPRDPLIRSLARRLLATQQRLHRPPYFVWKGWSSVDRAYWQQFGVRPIEEDASTVVRLIDQVMV